MITSALSRSGAGRRGKVAKSSWQAGSGGRTGEACACSARCRRERDARGGITGFLGALTDLTRPGEVEPDIQALEQLIHPEDRARSRDLLRAHLEGRTPLYESEYRVATGSGTWRWHLLRGRVVERDAAGKRLRMLGVNIDIERQKRAEAESELRSDQLRQLALELALAQERERRRIATRLRDEVGQILAVARAKLGQLLEAAARGDVPALAGDIRAPVDRAIENTRRFPGSWPASAR